MGFQTTRQHSAVIISKQNKALRRQYCMWICLCLCVWPGFTCMNHSIKTLQESGWGNDIITVRRSESWLVYWMNNKPATHWLMWCLVRWKWCPALAPLLCDNTMEILLPANPPLNGTFMLPVLPTLTFGFPCCLPPCTPGSVFVLWFTKYRYFVHSCVDMKMHFSPERIGLRMNDLWLKLHVWHIGTEYWRAKRYMHSSLFQQKYVMSMMN